MSYSRADTLRPVIVHRNFWKHVGDQSRRTHASSDNVLRKLSGVTYTLFIRYKRSCSNLFSLLVLLSTSCIDLAHCPRGLSGCSTPVYISMLKEELVAEKCGHHVRD